MDSSDPSRQLDILTKRTDVLRRLCEGPAHKRDLVDSLEQSRSTIDRAIRELEEIGFLQRSEDGIVATPAGRLAVEQFQSFQSGLGDIAAAETVLDPLPADALTTDVVTGSEAMPATEPVPYRPLERVHDALADAEGYRLLLPALDDPRHIRLLYEHVVTRSNSAELVVSPELFESLREEFPRRMAAMAEQEGFELFVATDLPPFALCLADTGESMTVSLIVFGDSGTVHGVLCNETADAVAWATERYERARIATTNETGSLAAADSPEEAADTDGGAAALGLSLSVPLERAGFVELGTDYFRAEPVADPTTAWRAGLSLAEVHTGYAVDRTADDGAGTIADHLREELLDGEDCLLVGPPGAGKSTLCKQVACEWYDDDTGPVLYREQGRGRSFDAVADLAVTVDAADGHTLVVVEDAVSPEANAIFDAMARLTDRDDVSVLLDARASEWLDPPRALDIEVDPSVYTMPTLDESDCKRLIEQFERTVGRQVDVPAAQLWEELRQQRTSDTATSPLLLLLHRLSTYADPLTDGQTRLEAAAAALAEDVADDDVARRVCLLANVLNASGLGVDRDALYAVAEPDEFARVDEAIHRLEGRVLFARPDGRYRTVHESWSVTYLATRTDASERFGDVMTALLSLADDAERRDRIRQHVDQPRTVTAIEEDPTTWAAETVEAVYAVGRDRPKLAALFGDGETDSVDIPAACPASVAAQRPVWLGEMFRKGGDYDAARAAFERLPTKDSDLAAERLLGLAWVAAETGEYDEAIERAEECRTQANATDRAHVDARANLVIGRVLTYRGEYEQARPHLRSALAGFEAAGDRRRTATALTQLGRAARDQGEYEQAREFHRRSLSTARALGDAAGEASGLTELGSTLFGLGAYDRATEQFERSLDIARDRGNRTQELSNRNWLGTVALYRSEYDRASEYFEQALVLARAVGDPQMEAEILGTRGLVAERLGNYEQAQGYLEDGLALAAEVGDNRTIAARHNNLGLVAVRLGEHERAREQFQAGLELTREHGHRRHEANSLNGLGHVARMRGAFERAREYHKKALSITREIDNPRREADSHNKLGLVALRLAEYDQATECFEQALSVAGELDHPREEAKSLRGLGETAGERGEYDQAAEYVEQARQRIESTGTKIETAQVRLAAARLALDRRAYERARDLAIDVRESTTEMGTTQWAARAERLLGRIAVAEGDGAAARESFESALDLLGELDAPQDELATLRLLLDRARERGDEDAIEHWREQIDNCVADAPEVIAKQDALE